ncbi:hypothetical protein SISNIDRAFT_469893 [Sistotremastrum niveocremeum HHB9708]|uniref:Uncharacterized protein n=1 Tax=Sistotremastrum niveocremeum HHB9708 TaxID=1314777 RepID=A0A164PKQ2_9AGAM|nr:hypothetical protein SISNIDRAFT_469893 [Sistotremastrum niveocremeum HHB9708]
MTPSEELPAKNVVRARGSSSNYAENSSMSSFFNLESTDSAGTTLKTPSNALSLAQGTTSVPMTLIVLNETTAKLGDFYASANICSGRMMAWAASLVISRSIRNKPPADLGDKNVVILDTVTSSVALAIMFGSSGWHWLWTICRIACNIGLLYTGRKNYNTIEVPVLVGVRVHPASTIYRGVLLASHNTRVKYCSARISAKFINTNTGPGQNI